MRFLSDKRIRALVYVLLITAVEFFDNGGTTAFMVAFIQCVLAIMMLCTVYSIIMDRFKDKHEQMKTALGRFIVRIFAPLAKKMQKSAQRKSNFVFGTDKFEFLGRSQKENGKKKRRKRVRLDPDACEDNREKIRLLYTGYVLKAADEGEEVSVSDTPFEICEKINSTGDDVLFDSYVEVRYADGCQVSDDTARECARIAGVKRSK